MKYVIIGNGVAGTSAAERICAKDPQGSIIQLTDESYPFYSRIRLIDFLAGEVGEDKVFLRTRGWYEGKGIELRTGTSVTEINPDRAEVVTQSGETVPYDRLLVATGGASFVPPIEGAGVEGVFTLRTLDDAKAIMHYAEGAEDVLLIGGGVLGLEAGNALCKGGRRIRVVEFFPRLLPRQMDPEGSKILCSQMEQRGFEFYLGAKTTSIGRSEGRMTAVLEDGRGISAGMVIVSAGIRANVGVAKEAGIECGKFGVLVDDYMRTGVQNIFSAGDAAEHRGVSYGIWPEAEAQGRVAGANMAGGSETFKGMTPSNVLKVAGIELAAAGDIDADSKCQCLVKADKNRGLYVKLVHVDGRLTGCIVLGTKKNRAQILKAVSEGRDVNEMKGELDEL